MNPCSDRDQPSNYRTTAEPGFVKCLKLRRAKLIRLPTDRCDRTDRWSGSWMRVELVSVRDFSRGDGLSVALAAEIQAARRVLLGSDGGDTVSARSWSVEPTWESHNSLKSRRFGAILVDRNDAARYSRSNNRQALMALRRPKKP
jgi:hypothetical protein